MKKTGTGKPVPKGESMVYQWKRRYPVAPEIFNEILTALPEITPEAVVDSARQHASPIHECFEWNDAIAAEEHRKQQARVMICNLVVVEEGRPDTRAFVSVQFEEEANRYVQIDEAFTDEEYRRQVLEQAYSEMESFKRKYHRLKELADVIRSIRKVLPMRAKGAM